jgi:NADH:ubiquinone oxidoreductase subunit 6 (subunit J)
VNIEEWKPLLSEQEVQAIGGRANAAVLALISAMTLEIGERHERHGLHGHYPLVLSAVTAGAIAAVVTIMDNMASDVPEGLRLDAIHRMRAAIIGTVDHTIAQLHPDWRGAN